MVNDSIGKFYTKKTSQSQKAHKQTKAVLNAHKNV